MLLEKGKYLKRRENGIWYIGVYFEGKTMWHSLKTRSKKEAMEKLKRPPEIIPSDNKSPLLSSFRDFVLHNRLKGVLRESTLNIYDRVISLFISVVGDRPLHEYTIWDVDKYKETRLSKSERIETGVGYYTLNVELQTLKSIMRKALDWELIEKNPFSAVKSMKIKKISKEFLTKEDLQKLVEVTAEDVLKDLFVFACYTGLRASEIINLKFSDCNHVQINVNNDSDFETKTGKTRSVPITNTVKEILERRLAQKSSMNDFVFHKKGFKLTVQQISYKFKAAVRKSQLSDGLHFHSCRHTCASWMIMKGISLSAVKEILGHSSTKLLDDVYGHLSERYKKEEMEKIED